MFDFFYQRRIYWEFQVADIAERLAVLGISLAPLFFKVLSLGSWTVGGLALPMSHGVPWHGRWRCEGDPVDPDPKWLGS